jgi:hypothetical protein
MTAARLDDGIARHRETIPVVHVPHVLVFENRDTFGKISDIVRPDRNKPFLLWTFVELASAQKKGWE